MHKILFYNKFIICLYMFRALCAHHQEVKIILCSIWYHHTVGGRPVHRLMTPDYIEMLHGQRHIKISKLLTAVSKKPAAFVLQCC